MDRSRLPKSRARRGLWLCAVLCLAAAACADPAPTAAPGEVVLSEWSIAVGERQGDHVSIRNAGQEAHNFVVSMPDGTPVATTGLMSPESASSVLLPDPGATYVFTCRLVEVEEDGEFEDHVEEGMQVVSTGDGARV